MHYDQIKQIFTWCKYISRKKHAWILDTYKANVRITVEITKLRNNLRPNVSSHVVKIKNKVEKHMYIIYT